MNSKTPQKKPTDWHVKPPADTERCSLCGCPVRYLGAKGTQQHRATQPADFSSARWFRRTQSRGGSRIYEVPGRQELLQRPPLPTAEERIAEPVDPPPGCKAGLRARQNISRAAYFLAGHVSCEATARALHVPARTLRGMLRDYPELIEAEIARAKLQGKFFKLPAEPSDQVRRRIKRAAVWLALGAPQHLVAKAMGLKPDSLSHCLRKHAELLAREVEAARRSGTLPEVLREPDPPPGPCQRIRRQIADAAARIAAGTTIEETAEALGVPIATLSRWPSEYRDLWQAEMDQAVAVVRRVIERIDAAAVVPPDPRAYFRAIGNCQRWTARPSGDRPEVRPLAELSAEMSLSAFYWVYVRPVCLEAHGAAPRTFDAYERTLGLWKRLTGDPPLAKIDQLTCAKFVAKLGERPGRKGNVSPNTIRKHCVQLQMVLDRAGPRTRDNRLGTGLIEEVPWLERPKPRPKAATDNFTLEEISQWLAACEIATKPEVEGIPAPDWWRALVRFLYNTGLRIGTAMGLRWDMIEGDWIVIPPEIMKTHAGKRHPLNKSARAAIEAIRTPDPRIFPHPYKRVTQIHKIRADILAASDIPPARRFGFHGLRKALATHLAQKNPMIATMMLGHTMAKTTQDHYVNPGIAAAVMAKVPQPT